MDCVGHSTVAMQLHYTPTSAGTAARDLRGNRFEMVRRTLGVTLFARDGRKMDATADLGAMKAVSADREKEVRPGSLLFTTGG
jgi:hypothetical protein